MAVGFALDTMILNIVCCLSVILAAVLANQYSVSINKPILKTKSWHFSTDYVRCFCNLPSCVTTGYMCKSSVGGCFSDVLDQSSSYYRGRHGCVEQLSDRDPKWKCQTKGGNERTIVKWKENPKSLLLCCYHDMCNHIENSPLKTIINSTILGDVTDDSDSRYQHQQETFLYSNSEVWFRAATIAVPICGAVILFVLIALAVKILKTEHQNSAVHKLGPSMYVHPMPQDCKHLKEKRHQTYDNFLRKEYISTHHQNVLYPDTCDEYSQQIQMPLLVQGDVLPGSSTSGEDKNETYAKLNMMNSEVESSKSIILEIEKNPPKCAEINIVSSSDKYSSNCGKLGTEKTMLS